MRSIVTVTSEATSRLLVDPGYARQFYGWTASDINDTMLEELILGASAFAERWCGRKLIEETVLEEFPLEQPASMVFLTRRPVWSTPLIVVTEGDVVRDTSDWRLDYDSGRLTKVGLSQWPKPLWGANWGSSLLSVAYRGGYTTATETGGANVPPDLRDAVLEMLNFNRSNSQRDPTAGAVRSEEVPGAVATAYYDVATSAQSSESNSAMPPSAEAKLLPYRRKVRFA